MNLFVHWKNAQGREELITAPLDGTILPGVTRDSIIQLAIKEGITVTQKVYTIDELVKALQEKRVKEIFGAGTAAIVSPVKNIGYQHKDYAVPIIEKDGAGPLALKFSKIIMDIQYGEDLH